MKIGKRDYLRLEDAQLHMGGAINKIDDSGKVINQIIGKNLRQMKHPEKLRLVKFRLKNARENLQSAMGDFYEAVHGRKKPKGKIAGPDLFAPEGEANEMPES